MKLMVLIIGLVILGSLAGCISANVDAKDASKEWAEVGKSWSEAFKEQGQSEGESQ